MDLDTIRQSKENEYMFCKIWAEQYIKFNTDILIFFNRLMTEDYYFNRIIFSNSEDLKNFNLYLFQNKIKKIFKFLKTKNIKNFFFHVEDTFANLLNYFNHCNLFKKVDRIITLIHYCYEYTKFPVESTKNISIFSCDGNFARNEGFYEYLYDWFHLYCSSFNISSIKYQQSIWRTLNYNYDKFIFVKINKKSGKKDSSNKISVGCGLLYPYKKTLGLYCLGIHHNYRGQGLAKEIIKFSINFMFKNKFDFLCLQTLESDDLLPLYKKTGFHKTHSNTIYTLSNS